MPRITFLGSGQIGFAPNGATVLEAALSLKAPMGHLCNGGAACTTCRFEVVAGAGNLSEREGYERNADLGPDLRLGCQARILGDVVIRVVTVPGKTVL